MTTPETTTREDELDAAMHASHDTSYDSTRPIQISTIHYDISQLHECNKKTDRNTTYRLERLPPAEAYGCPCTCITNGGRH